MKGRSYHVIGYTTDDRYQGWESFKELVEYLYWTFYPIGFDAMILALSVLGVVILFLRIRK